MKRNLIFLLMWLVIIICNNRTSTAGCGMTCLTAHQGESSNDIDTAYLDQNAGFVSMYTTYNSCCVEVLGPDMFLIWYKDGIPFDTTDINDAIPIGFGDYSTTFTTNTPGLYEVFFINYQSEYNGCGKVRVLRTEGIQSVPIIQPFTQPAANIEDEEVKNGYRIYPNPSSEGYFYIEYLSDLNINKIEIYNIGGQKILSIVPNGSEVLNINTLDFKPGLYIVKIDSATGLIIERIMVK